MKIPLSEDYKTTRVFEVKLFKMTAIDQIARVCLFGEEPSIEIALVHVVKHLGQFGTPYKCLGDWKMLIGTPGKPTPIGDPDNCPFCKVQDMDGNIGMLTRKYGTNLLVYDTDTNGKLKAGPGGGVAASAIPWRFSAKPFKRLLDIKNNYGDPKHGLRMKDLHFRCENTQFQGYVIDPVQDCLWMSSKEYAQYCQGVFNAGKLDDFGDYLGFSTDTAGAEKLIAEGEAKSAGQMVGQASMNNVQELAKLLDDSMPKSPTTPTFVPPVSSQNNPPVAPMATPVAQPPQQNKMPPPPPPPTEPAGGVRQPNPNPQTPQAPQQAPAMPSMGDFEALLNQK
jgi:hypothetical protein